MWLKPAVFTLSLCFPSGYQHFKLDTKGISFYTEVTQCHRSDDTSLNPLALYLFADALCHTGSTDLPYLHIQNESLCRPQT